MLSRGPVRSCLFSNIKQTKRFFRSPANSATNFPSLRSTNDQKPPKESKVHWKEKIRHKEFKRRVTISLKDSFNDPGESEVDTESVAVNGDPHYSLTRELAKPFAQVKLSNLWNLYLASMVQLAPSTLSLRQLTIFTNFIVSRYVSTNE